MRKIKSGSEYVSGWTACERRPIVIRNMNRWYRYIAKYPI